MPSRTAIQPASEPDEWKVEGPTLEQQTPANQEPGPGPETGVAPESPFEQEPGWTGGLANPGNGPEFEIPPDQLPVDPRSFGLKYTIGPIDIRPMMSFSTTYSDNILASTTSRKEDFIYTIGPGAIFALGDYIQKQYTYLTLQYVPVLNLYNHYSTLNSLDQHLRIDGQWGMERLKLSTYFGYDKSFGGNRDIGGLVNSEYYTMGAEAKYLLNEQISFEALGDQTFSDYGSSGIGSREFVNHEYLNYAFTPKLTGGIGAAFGILQPYVGGTQTYEQGLFRLQFTSTEKINFTGNFGFEFRQFPSGVGTRFTPVFTVTANYLIFPGSTLTLSGGRNVTYSAAVTGSNYTATNVTAGITQHVIGNLSVGFNVGFENDSYFFVSGAQTGAVNREDNYITLSPNLTYRWNDWANISVSYLYRDNQSNAPARSFYNNQVAVQVHIGF
ncbi:MAG: outer membrane beta-barrel protein [Verrucomicrobia bacterium]|nr:outer membrane beta-barrel protein [Verrucomicrobiota bacterium]